MAEGPFLAELLLLIVVAAAGAAIFERLRLPSIAGFLVMGALVGPGGLGLLADREQVRALAELGVVFLLFQIGLELPIERLRRNWQVALAAGALQVSVTLVGVALLGAALGLEARSAVAVGALVAMSSTALVMRLLSDRGEVDAPQGQLCAGILLFQDLCIVPFLLAIPMLAADAPADSWSIGLELARAAVSLVGFAVLAWLVLPRLLDRIAGRGSRELFAMLAFIVVLGSAVLSHAIGLTLAVGAFVGGLVLSATPYAHQLFAEVLPLRGVLLGIFFTAVGMLFAPADLAHNGPAVLVYVLGVIVFKAGCVIGIVALALRQGLRVAVLTGLALAQTGEFSFVLAAAASEAGLVDAGLHGIFVAGSIVTLLATPALIAVAPRVASRVAGQLDRLSPAPEHGQVLEGHVALIGFGPAGRTLARILRARRIAYAVVEANATSVQEALRRGEPLVYGDATRPSILERIGIRAARLVVVAISDPTATREVASRVRQLAPHVDIVVRTHYVQDVDALREAGASMVVAEEFESTLELVAETLKHFGVGESAIARFAGELREEGYEHLRAPTGAILDPWLAELLDEEEDEDRP